MPSAPGTEQTLLTRREAGISAGRRSLGIYSPPLGPDHILPFPRDLLRGSLNALYTFLNRLGKKEISFRVLGQREPGTPVTLN